MIQPIQFCLEPFLKCSKNVLNCPYSKKPKFQIQRDKDSYIDTSLRSFEQVCRNIESTYVFSAKPIL